MQEGLHLRLARPDRLGRQERRTEQSLAELAQGSPQGLAETKRLLNAELLARIDVQGAVVAARSAELFASPEAQQAFQAFLRP